MHSLTTQHDNPITANEAYSKPTASYKALEAAGPNALPSANGKANILETKPLVAVVSGNPLLLKIVQ